ncbi:uncharacterized protein LOC121805647 isoform X2 [Salvia splendens]|uniref:uncharacterized protein LOC121805647 isoform X1 n=1 Tax=Salvia splendens TaxID=180675 RepID=UPI001C26F6E3|nr:uncharacterized protein LOC121805647 isoform X1 [Salvia splendens]XP_042061522.1 uncharacterized protein LOC121805647 isoform X2 [Salvia splendens]
MACIQLLKPTPSNSQSKIACFYADFSLQKRRIRLRNSGIQNNYRRFRVTCKVEDGDKQSNGEEPPESLFTKELRRRGMTPTSLLEEKNKDSVREEIKFREEDGGWGYSRRNGITTGAETNLTGQREKSMALNSEGLEYFGAEFVHDGCDNPASPPPYVDPYELLEEERMYKTAPPLN